MSQSRPGAVPEPTQIAGRYQIVQKLGAGAFGTVYKAKDSVLGRMVAIKTIRLDGLAATGASLDELMERFKREAQVSAQLKHPNIVTVYDIGSADGSSYLAMEFIDGVGLERVIASAGRLPLERAAAIGAQIADALDFAHRHGVVHRDIKPANIMIESGDRVKVTDFGIAKVTSGEHLTMTGSLLGTPSYMSPEQARGGDLDGRSDLFAVGCILYEMLAGQKAFRGESITALIFKIITEEPPPLASIEASIPPEMVGVVTRALAKAPESRFQDGRELADALLAFTRAGATPTVRQVEMATIATPPPSPPPTVARPGAVASSATGPLATPPALAPTRVAPPPPPRPAAAAPVEAPTAARPRSSLPAPAVRKSGSGATLLLGLAFVGVLFLAGVVAAGWFFLRKTRAPAEARVMAEPATTAMPGAPDAGVAPPVTEAAAEPAPATAPVQTAPAATVPARTEATPALTARAEAPPAAPPQPRGRGRAEPPAGAPAHPALPAAGEAQPPAGGADFSFLEKEEDPSDGAEAGQRLAQSYRSGRSSGGSPLAGSRFQRRERSPRQLGLIERPAVAVVRHVITAEELFHKKNGRYGTLEDLRSAKLLFLDVPIRAKEFQRRNYRFELTIETDGFKVQAVPMGAMGRPFIGDDTGFIREGVE